MAAQLGHTHTAPPTQRVPSCPLPAAPTTHLRHSWRCWSKPTRAPCLQSSSEPRELGGTGSVCRHTIHRAEYYAVASPCWLHAPAPHSCSTLATTGYTAMACRQWRTRTGSCGLCRPRNDCHRCARPLSGESCSVVGLQRSARFLAALADAILQCCARVRADSNARAVWQCARHQAVQSCRSAPRHCFRGRLTRLGPLQLLTGLWWLQWWLWGLQWHRWRKCSSRHGTFYSRGWGWWRRRCSFDGHDGCTRLLPAAAGRTRQRRSCSSISTHLSFQQPGRHTCTARGALCCGTPSSASCSINGGSETSSDKYRHWRRLVAR